ncbi:hypothetical protein [Citrobacter sp. RHB21-C01]|uniref:hypothetical protein n=1 Tax=Citrobacter sp. RHB21-C01 TaxID=2742622 RepID=UPI0012E4A5A3|nr:hypothetical protein [Salmonella enterica subsp. enterica serovar Senftenberg]
MQNLTLGDVIEAHAKKGDLKDARLYSLLMQLSKILELQTRIEDVCIDRIYDGEIANSTLLSYRSMWKRAVKMVFPDARVRSYVQRRTLRKKEHEENQKGMMTIPIPLPERGITVYVNAPIELTEWDVERVNRVLMAYAK